MVDDKIKSTHKNIIMSHNLILTLIYQMINYFFLKSVFSSIFGDKKDTIRLSKTTKNSTMIFLPSLAFLFYFCYFFVYFGESPKNWVMTQLMKKEGASHLPAPPVGRSCLDDGPIPTAPPMASMVINQYICIFESYLSPHSFQEFTCSHSSVPYFTPSYYEMVTSI